MHEVNKIYCIGESENWDGQTSIQVTEQLVKREYCSGKVITIIMATPVPDELPDSACYIYLTRKQAEQLRDRIDFLLG